MLFFDKNDIFSQMERKKELRDLETGTAFYKKEIESISKQLTELRTNPYALEKYTREQLLMKKNGEDIFITETPAKPAK